MGKALSVAEEASHFSDCLETALKEVQEIRRD